MESCGGLRALTVRQPWAWALIEGYKDIENRSWRTNMRGWILLHAGAAKPTDESLAAAGNIARRSVPPSAPLGAVIGAIKISGMHAFETCGRQCSPGLSMTRGIGRCPIPFDSQGRFQPVAR